MARIPVAERRDALIEAATRVMERDGVAETTTRKIAAEAGMPLASLHYAFASRGELVAAAARRLAVEIAEVIAASSSVHGDLRSTLRRSLDGYLGFLRANPGRVLALYETQAGGVRHEELHSIAANRVARGTELVRYFLERAAAEGGVEFTRPVDRVAVAFLDALDGFSMRWIILRDDAELDESVGIAVDWVGSLTRPLPSAAAERVRAAFAAPGAEGLAAALIEGERTMTGIAEGLPVSGPGDAAPSPLGAPTIDPPQEVAS